MRKRFIKKKPRASKSVLAVVNKQINKKVINAHLQGIHRISRGPSQPNRMMVVLKTNHQFALNGASPLSSAVQITADGTNRISLGYGSYTAQQFANGIYHYFGSNYPSGTQAIATGMYSGFRVWRNVCKLTFVPVSQAAIDTYCVYLYPTTNNNQGSAVVPTFAGVTEQKGVKYYFLNSTNTANPKTIHHSMINNKLLGIDAATYTASQYDSTITGGIVSSPGVAATSLNTYWQFGVISTLPTALAGTVTGTFYFEIHYEYEFFNRNDTSQLVPT